MKTSFIISDLSFRYGTTDTLQHISLMLPKNKIIGIIGPNGCGKSTLLAHLGRLKPSHGIIRLDDKYIEEYSARAYAQKVAMLSQLRSNMVEDFLVKDLVLMGRYPYKPQFGNYNTTDHQMVADVMKQIGIAHYAETSLSHLSGGERQRVFIAKALVQQPEVLLLDEPTNHLDMKYKIALMEILKQFEGTTVVVLHDLNLVARYCDYVILMQNGRVVDYGEPAKVMQVDQLSSVFEVPFHSEHHDGILYLYY